MSDLIDALVYTSIKNNLNSSNYKAYSLLKNKINKSSNDDINNLVYHLNEYSLKLNDLSNKGFPKFMFEDIFVNKNLYIGASYFPSVKAWGIKAGVPIIKLKIIKK